MQIQPDSKIGDIAARHPLATRVFARHGIDFCCGGGVALARACERRGLDTATVLGEIAETLAERGPEEPSWNDASSAAIVHHIIDDFHRPLREELPRLRTMAEKVARVHAERDPEARLPAIVATLGELSAELEEHMAREEEALFPAILDAAVGGAPVTPFIDDHERAGRALAHLRELTEDYSVPQGACNTWRALWHGLADLERTTHEHIHLENNVLFPRVAAG